MGGELVWWDAAVVQWSLRARWDWSSQFLSFVPSPPHAPAGIALCRTRVQTGAAGGAGFQARLSVPYAISQVLGPPKTAPGAGDRHVRTQIQDAFPGFQVPRDPSDALRRAQEGRSPSRLSGRLTADQRRAEP